MRILLLSAFLVATAFIMSCSTTDNPVTPATHYPITLTIESATSTTVSLRWTSDTAAASVSTQYVLLRGTSAAALIDTAFHGSSPLATVHFVDSNGGAYLSPGTEYFYRCVRIKDGAVFDTSATVSTATGAGVTISQEKVTPISATIHVEIEAVAFAAAPSVVILRGASAGALSDTVFAGVAPSRSFSVVDSNRGHWLVPSTPYAYRCNQVRGGGATVFSMSNVLALTTSDGQYMPFVPGSVWFYNGYVTDTITGGRKTGSDYTAMDSMLPQRTFQGFDDVFPIVHVKRLATGTVRDTAFTRFVGGDFYLWSQVGYDATKQKWVNAYPFATAPSTYLLNDGYDTVNTGTTTIIVHSRFVGKLNPTESVTVPLGTFTAKSGELDVAVTASISGFPVLTDTIPAGTRYFAPGIGRIKEVLPPFMARGTGLVKLPRQEGYVEELSAMRVKY